MVASVTAANFLNLAILTSHFSLRTAIVNTPPNGSFNAAILLSVCYNINHPAAFLTPVGRELYKAISDIRI